ncbi:MULTISPECIES: hypothetical protein [unclassified Lysinibacillus]|uniref:WapI family immunity protein n=1 Tax=unclassified Lysinibacillus TaxID=2636778 RepID=UPI00381BD454
MGEENEHVEFGVLTRSHPNSIDYWEVNWIVSTIKIEIPGYLVQFNADLRTDELKDFLDELNMIRSNLSGKAILKNLDDQQGSIIVVSSDLLSCGLWSCVNF